MATELQRHGGEPQARPPRRSPTEARVRRLRFTREMYHAMANAGVLPEGRRCQLLDGIVFVTPSMNHPHWLTLNHVDRKLVKLLPDGWCSTCQSPIVMDEFGEPEPDIAILRGSLRDYDVKPTAADTAIVIEVTDTTGGFDRRRKLAAYAEAGIPEYWIIDLARRVVEVRTDPRARVAGTPGGYAVLHEYRGDEPVPPRLDGAAIAEFPVTELIPL